VAATQPDPAPVIAPSNANVSIAGCKPTLTTRSRYELTFTVFTKPLPAKYTPWPFRYVQAYSQYGQVTASPINWGAFPYVLEIDRVAYDDREPWNPAPVPWKKVGQAAKEREGLKAALTEEGMRKRFMKANQAIFEATGVYFTRGSLGLQGTSPSIPIESDMRRALKKLSSGAAQTKKHKKPHVGEIEFEPEAIDYELKIVELLLQPPDGLGPVTRHMTQKQWRKLHLVPGQTVCCSAETFDRWYSSFCFGVRHSLPKRVYKLAKLGGGFAYIDEGMPPVTIHTLIDTYCLSQEMGTIQVSDMILDEIHRCLQNEAALNEKYGGMGSICEDDCNDIIRFMDLTPADIENLWLSTEVDDPIRKLLVHLFLLRAVQSEWSNQHMNHARRDARFVGHLYSVFARHQCHLAIQSFAKELSPEDFCETYHNHRNREPCYLSRLPSALSKAKIDDTLNTAKVHKVVIEGVDYSIVNKTGDSLNMNALCANTSKWEWDGVQSINSWIYFPRTKGTQIRQPRPIYFPPEAADPIGRYPSHPGYKDPAWQLHIERDEYTHVEWELAKPLDIPDEATRCRDDKELGEYLFDMEDDTWIPPPEFARDLHREEGQNWHEFQAYRRWLWTEEGNTIPKMTCKRWWPFMGPTSHREDIFRDAVNP
jgi:hypothetical protein